MKLKMFGGSGLCLRQERHFRPVSSRRLFIALSGVLVLAASISAAHSQATEAEAIHMACLLTQDVRGRIDACTAAINRGDLKSTLRDDAHIVRASMYMMQGRFEEARADLEAARRLDPNNSSIIEQALAKVAEFEANASAPQAQERMAFIVCQNGSDPPQRLDACNNVIAASEGDSVKQAAAYALRAAASADDGDYDSTISDLETAIDLDPAQSFYPSIRARSLFFAGRYGEAKEAYQALDGATHAAENLPVIAALDYLTGEPVKSVDAFQAAHKADIPGNTFGFYAALVQSEISDGDIAPFAEMEFDAVREGDFGVALATYRRGEMDADGLLQAANSLPFQQAKAHCMAQFNIGHRLALMGDKAGARTPLADASENCDHKTFEYHAAMKWLKQLSSQGAP